MAPVRRKNVTPHGLVDLESFPVADISGQALQEIETGRGYIILGRITKEKVDMICRRLLANDVIERYQYYMGV